MFFLMVNYASNAKKQQQKLNTLSKRNHLHCSRAMFKTPNQCFLCEVPEKKFNKRNGQHYVKVISHGIAIVSVF